MKTVILKPGVARTKQNLLIYKLYIGTRPLVNGLTSVLGLQSDTLNRFRFQKHRKTPPELREIPL